MKRTNKRQISIRNSFMLAIIVPGVILVVTLIVSAALSILYVRSANRNILYI